MLTEIDNKLWALLLSVVAEAFISARAEFDEYSGFKLWFDDSESRRAGQHAKNAPSQPPSSLSNRAPAQRSKRGPPVGPSIWLERDGSVTILGGRLVLRGGTFAPAATEELDAQVQQRLGSPRMRRLAWEVLPPGWIESMRMNPHGGPNTAPAQEMQIERLGFIDSLGSAQWYAGSVLGRRVYYVAVFPGVALADCPRFGNAVYWCESIDRSWQDTFRRTKAEALKAGANRVIHSGAWQERLRALVILGAMRDKSSRSSPPWKGLY